MTPPSDGAVRATLGRVVAAARLTLDDLEPDDRPHRLKRVAASSARRLPPPLEKVLLEELEANDGFRSAVRERWLQDPPDDPIGSAFLDDPARGWEAAAEAASNAQASAAGEEIGRLRTELTAIRAERDEARRRLEGSRDEIDAVRRQMRAAVADARVPLAETVRELRAALGRAEDEALAARAEVEGMAAERDAAVRAAERLATRERRRSAPQGDVGERPAAIPTSDSEEIARWLDAAERALRPYREPSPESPSAAAARPFTLPLGVVPDTSEAIDAIASLAPDVVLVDGYNVAGAIGAPANEPRAARDRVVAVCGRLAVRGLPVVVVFDALGSGGRSAASSDLGVAIRFATETTADDAIVAAVVAASRPVVVTNDRELRERSTSAGAVVVWSDALAAWVDG